MNSYPFFNELGIICSSHIALSYDIIVHMNMSRHHGTLPIYVLSGTSFQYKTLIGNKSMNSYLFFMNYGLFCSSYIALSYDIIVHMNMSRHHGTLPIYV